MASISLELTGAWDDRSLHTLGNSLSFVATC